MLWSEILHSNGVIFHPDFGEGNNGLTHEMNIHIHIYICISTCNSTHEKCGKCRVRSVDWLVKLCQGPLSSLIPVQLLPSHTTGEARDSYLECFAYPLCVHTPEKSTVSFLRHNLPLFVCFLACLFLRQSFIRLELTKCQASFPVSPRYLGVSI